jgi:hypothetical protein
VKVISVLPSAHNNQARNRGEDGGDIIKKVEIVVAIAVNHDVGILSYLTTPLPLIPICGTILCMDKFGA